MGSPCQLRWAPRQPAEDMRLAQQVQARVAELEARYSRYQEDSLCSRINRSAGSGSWVDLDPESSGLLDYAQTAWEQSEGLFDITSGVLRRAWDFRSGQLPDAEAVQVLLPLVGWEQVQRQGQKLRLPKPGMELDFGGFVKEYTVDVCVALCRAAGLETGLVDLGGDIGLIGPHADGSAWKVGIRHPRQPEKAILRVDLRWGALASSGDYERFMEIDGQRYCHILNPRNGWPVQGLAGVSVIADRCLLAGTASTIALLKQGDAVDWLDALGLPWLGVAQDLRLLGPLAASPDPEVGPASQSGPKGS